MSGVPVLPRSGMHPVVSSAGPSSGVAQNQSLHGSSHAGPFAASGETRSAGGASVLGGVLLAAITAWITLRLYVRL